MTSYARQADDDSLFAYARRIKARAFDQCGELLAEISTASGARTDLRGEEHEVEPREGDHPRLTKETVARDAGLSEQRKTSCGSPMFPKQFEALVDNQGAQRVLPGAARSAYRPAKAREAGRHVRMRSRALQRAPGGLLEPEAEPLPDSRLFDAPAGLGRVTWPADPSLAGLGRVTWPAAPFGGKPCRCCASGTCPPTAAPRGTRFRITPTQGLQRSSSSRSRPSKRARRWAYSSLASSTTHLHCSTRRS